MNLETSINKLINFLPTHVNKGGCICDVLDVMYKEGRFEFFEMIALRDFIESHISEMVLNEAVETGNYNLLITALLGLYL